MLFFNNNLHFLLDILQTAELPSGNTCQLYNKTPQKSQNHLPIVQQNLTTTILIEFEMFFVSNSIIGIQKMI